MVIGSTGISPQQALFQPTLAGASPMGVTQSVGQQPSLFASSQQAGATQPQSSVDALASLSTMLSSLMSVLSTLISVLMQKISTLTANKAGSGASSMGLTGGGVTGGGTSPSSGGDGSNGASSSGSSGGNTTSNGGIISLNGSAKNPTGNGSGKPNVVFEGDSLSVNTGGNYSYTDQLGKKLAGQGVKTSFQAHGGDQLGVQIKSETGQVNAQFDPNSNNNVVVLWGGTNDLHGGKSGQQVYNDLKNVAQQYKDKGYKVVVLTSIQLGGTTGSTSEDQRRLDFNNLIRQQGGPWDGLVDVASLPQFSDKDNNVTNNHDIYAGDGVHLTQKGYGIVADYVGQALQQMGIG